MFTRAWDQRGSYHIIAQTGTQSPIRYVGACLQYTNQCTQTNILWCTRLQANTNRVGTYTDTKHTNTVNVWINKKGAAPACKAQTHECRMRHLQREVWKKTPPLRPGVSLHLPPAPNHQYMFKGHPLTFDSHRPLCDLLLSAEGFEEHSDWGAS